VVFVKEKYLEQCLLSILNNTTKNIEVIAINDGSPDNTWEEMQIYKEGAVYTRGKILIRPDDPRIEISILHEVAHWTDNKVIGNLISKGSSQAEFKTLVDEIETIPRMKTLFDKLKLSKDSIIRDLTGKNEIFARLIEQYLVSKNPAMRDPFLIKRKVFKITKKNYKRV